MNNLLKPNSLKLNLILWKTLQQKTRTVLIKN
jgi:hypothetical protein